MSAAHQTPERIPDNDEQKLLAFLEELIIDLAKSHPAITQAQVAGWLAGVIVGHQRKARR